MVYLIRHTTPNVPKGTCYGQSDIDVTPTFDTEAKAIQAALPTHTAIHVYTSTLQRCTKLAHYLYGTATATPLLMEINCGSWEMQHWDSIPTQVLDPWMQDYVHTPMPNGESYVQFYNRIVAVYDSIILKHSPNPIAIVAHGGVLRSILSYITRTPLEHSFEAFKIHYGCVVQVNEHDNSYSYLHNVAHAAEQHKPSI